MKKLTLPGILITLVIPSVFGQGMEELIKGGSQDANYLIQGYTTPFIRAFGTGLNQGWYNTADTHKFPGFDLTVSVSLIGVPSSDKNFTVDNTKLSTIELDQTTNGKGDIPTFFGSTSPTNKTFSFRDATPGSFDVPAGIYDLPIARVPVPILNLGFGLPKGIELVGRFVPNLNLGDVGTLGLWGIGVKHDVKQYIPGLKLLPFSMSIFAGYTSFKSEVTIDDSQDQFANFEIKSTTLQLLASKKIAVLTIYGGVGYDLTKGDLAIKGTYDIDGNAGSQELTDPVDFSAKHNSARITAGLRLKLGPITLHGDYTQAKYSAITAGFGISVR